MVGIGGEVPFDAPIEEMPFHLKTDFFEYIADETGYVCGAEFCADSGHGQSDWSANYFRVVIGLVEIKVNKDK